MAGSAILRKLKNAGYGEKENSGEFLIPDREELDLLDSQQVKLWFQKNRPTVVILAAAKV